MLRGDCLSQRADLFQQLATEYSIRPTPTARVEIDRHGDCHRLLANERNIREVIAFPMNQKAQDLMMGAPGDVTDKQLRELHIKIDVKEK